MGGQERDHIHQEVQGHIHLQGKDKWNNTLKKGVVLLIKESLIYKESCVKRDGLNTVVCS